MLFNFRKLPIPHKNIYRSGSLEFTQNFPKHLAEYNIQFYIDLRTYDECLKFNPEEELIKNKISYTNFGLSNQNHKFREQNFYSVEDLINSNKEILKTYQKNFSEIIKLICGIDHTCFGCFAGKDRTGLLSILILLQYDVDIEVIIDDYKKTLAEFHKNIDNFKNNWEKRSISKDEYKSRFICSPEIPLEIIDYINVSCGGIAKYLGVSHEKI